MENTTLDMQAFLNPKGGTALFAKVQDKSPIESRNGKSSSFISVLDEKGVEAINDEPNIDKFHKDPDHEAINFNFAPIQVPDPMPLGRMHQLWKNTSPSGTEEMISLPLLDKVNLAAVDSMENTQHTTTPVSTKMTSQANQSRLVSHRNGNVNSDFLGIRDVIQSQPVMAPQPGDETSRIGFPVKNSLSSSDEAILSTFSNQTGDTIKAHLQNQVKQFFPSNAKMTGHTGRPWENEAVFKMASALAPGSKEHTSRQMDQSSATASFVLPAGRVGNNMKSAVPLNPDFIGQAGLAQTDNAVREAVPATLGVTVVDTFLPETNSPSVNHTASHFRPEKSWHKAEAGSTDRSAEALRQKDDRSVADSIFSDIRRTTVLHRDNRMETSLQKGGAHIATTTQKPIALVNDRVGAIGPFPSEGLTQVELADKAVFMKSSPAGTTADNLDDQQGWNAASERHHNTTHRDELLLRTEMTNILTRHGNKLSTSEGPAGIDSQAVIDQILDAKKFMNNGFGRVRITLDPPNLGTVNLEIVVRKELVEVVMTADNSSVQQALQSRVDDIRTALQRHDLRIENFQILLQENAENQQQAYSGATFGQRHEHESRQHHIEDSNPVQPPLQVSRESEATKGLVSIFV